MTDQTRNLLISLASHMAYMQGQLEARHELDDPEDYYDYYWYRESVALRQKVTDALADGPAVPAPSDDERVIVLGFQNGPIAEVGVNGITHEALLAVLIDRLRGFQSGPFSCRENAITLTKLEEAQMWLHRRTAQRIERGVEGTHQV